MICRHFVLGAAAVALGLLGRGAEAVTIYVPTVNPQLIPQNGVPSGPDGYLNRQAMLQGTLFEDWQHYETRGPGVVTPGAGPATNGAPQMLQNNAFLVSTPTPVSPHTQTKVTIGVPILKNPNAAMADITGGATGIDFYNPADYFTYADFQAGRVTLSYSYHNPVGAGLPEASVVGFESSRYFTPGTGTELKFEPANNPALLDQSSANNGVLYNNPNVWITTPNVLANTVNLNIGGTPSGQLDIDGDALDLNFAGTYFRNLLVSMGSGTQGRQSWIDNLTLTYDGTNGGVAFSFTYDFGDVAPAAAALVPEPSSLALLVLGSLSLAARRRRK